MQAETTRLNALVAAAQEAAKGMGAAAGRKPNETELKSDARTFRGLATMLNGLSEEANRREEKLCTLSAKLHRIAGLEVRGAAELIERGDWKKLCAELQAIAQEALGTGDGASRRRERT